MIRVLIVDDSSTARKSLQFILKGDSDIELVGSACDGIEAIEMVKRLRPDVVIMDIYMPRMDGFEATRQIMENNPVPIVVCSAAWGPDEVDMTMKAMAAGAVSVLAKPPIIAPPSQRNLLLKFIQTVKLMSGVKVVRRHKSRQEAAEKIENPVIRDVTPSDQVELVVMGVSTGGPPVLEELLTSLPAGFGVPITIVQHITPGFLPGLVDWLARKSPLSIKIAEHGEPLLAGTVYFAPDEVQMAVSREKRIILNKRAPAEKNLKPSVSYLFRSAAENLGVAVVGVLLTGMGMDGARELKEIQERGGVTIVQDKQSSMVHGMPGEAIRLGAGQYVLPPFEISRLLQKVIKIG